MSKTGFVIGIISIVCMFIGFVPCFGWAYWFILPLALLGLILCIFGYNNSATASDRNQAVTGIVLNVITLVLGTIRWFMGGFFL